MHNKQNLASVTLFALIRDPYYEVSAINCALDRSEEKAVGSDCLNNVKRQVVRQSLPALCKCLASRPAFERHRGYLRLKRHLERLEVP